MKGEPHMEKMLTLPEARTLCRTLVRAGNGIVVRTELRRDGRDYRVTFTGGRKGEHSIWLSVSSEERIRAHFDGYCSSNGLAPATAPGPMTVAQKVRVLRRYIDRQMERAAIGEEMGALVDRGEFSAGHATAAAQTQVARAMGQLRLHRADFEEWMSEIVKTEAAHCNRDEIPNAYHQLAFATI